MMRNVNIAAWQRYAGLEEATGKRAQILRDMSDAAFELIKVIELERSGIRDGDGCWSGTDVVGGVMHDLRSLMNRLDTYDKPPRSGDDNVPFAIPRPSWAD